MTVFIRVWPVLKSLPAIGRLGLRRQLASAGMSAVRLGAPFAYGMPSLRARRRRSCSTGSRSSLVSSALLEGGQVWCAGPLLGEDLGAAAPDHHQPIAACWLFELPDVGAHLLGQIPLVLAGLDVRAVQPLDVEGVEDRLHRLDALHLGPDLARGGARRAPRRSWRPRSSCPRRCPSRRRRGRRGWPADEVLHHRGPVVRPLAEADGPHLGERTDGLGEARRTAKTPAMNVVLTAPRPTSRMPSLPWGGRGRHGRAQPHPPGTPGAGRDETEKASPPQPPRSPAARDPPTPHAPTRPRPPRAPRGGPGHGPPAAPGPPPGPARPRPAPRALPAWGGRRRRRRRPRTAGGRSPMPPPRPGRRLRSPRPRRGSRPRHPARPR